MSTLAGVIECFESIRFEGLNHRLPGSKLMQLRNVKYVTNKKSQNNAFCDGLLADSVTILVASQPRMSVKTKTYRT